MKYKIVVSEIVDKEVPDFEYKNTYKKDAKDENIYEYMDTGKTKIDRRVSEVYIQELNGLDVEKLAMYVNEMSQKSN